MVPILPLMWLVLFMSCWFTTTVIYHFAKLLANIHDRNVTVWIKTFYLLLSLWWWKAATGSEHVRLDSFGRLTPGCTKIIVDIWKKKKIISHRFYNRISCSSNITRTNCYTRVGSLVCKDFCCNVPTFIFILFFYQ